MEKKSLFEQKPNNSYEKFKKYRNKKAFKNFIQAINVAILYGVALGLLFERKYYVLFGILSITIILDIFIKGD